MRARRGGGISEVGTTQTSSAESWRGTRRALLPHEEAAEAKTPIGHQQGGSSKLTIPKAAETQWKRTP